MDRESWHWNWFVSLFLALGVLSLQPKPAGPKNVLGKKADSSLSPVFLPTCVFQRSSVRAMASLHDVKGKTLGGGTRSNPTDGTEFDFAQLKGKVVLINNVATM